MASRTDLTLDIRHIARDSKHDEYSSEYRRDSRLLVKARRRMQTGADLTRARASNKPTIVLLTRPGTQSRLDMHSAMCKLTPYPLGLAFPLPFNVKLASVFEWVPMPDQPQLDAVARLLTHLFDHAPVRSVSFFGLGLREDGSCDRHDLAAEYHRLPPVADGYHWMTRQGAGVARRFGAVPVVVRHVPSEIQASVQSDRVPPRRGLFSTPAFISHCCS